MNEQPVESPAAPEWQFYRHMPVYTSNGRRLGRTEEIGHAVDYIHVQQGSVFVRDWYVPMALVRDVTGRGVYLSVNRQDLIRRRLNIPPEDFLARQGATLGYEYTSSGDLPPYSDRTAETGE